MAVLKRLSRSPLLPPKLKNAPPRAPPPTGWEHPDFQILKCSPPPLPPMPKKLPPVLPPRRGGSILIFSNHQKSSQNTRNFSKKDPKKLKNFACGADFLPLKYYQIDVKTQIFRLRRTVLPCKPPCRAPQAIFYYFLVPQSGFCLANTLVEACRRRFFVRKCSLI